MSVCIENKKFNNLEVCLPKYNIFNTGKQAITKVAYWIERSKQRKELANLNDYMLKDIGYSREEALIEGSKPFWK